MKKIIFILTTVLMLSVAAVCAASPGKLLDAELAIIEKFTTATSYKAIEPLLAPEYKQDFNEESFNKFKELSAKNFGKLNSKTLRYITKLDDADLLEFQASFEKAPQTAYVFAFVGVEKEKPLLRDFSIQLPEATQQ